MSAPVWHLYGDTPIPDDMLGPVSVDTETTGLKWTDETLGVSLAWHTRDGVIKSCYFSAVAGLFSDDMWESDRVEALIVALLIDHVTVGHYVSFDARVLFRTFGMVPMRSFDTWHMAKSTYYAVSYSLVNVAAYLGIRDPEWTDQKKYRSNLAAQAPLSVAAYARKDAVYTLQVFDKLWPPYYALGLSDKDMEFSRVTYEMMARGFPLNEELLDQRIESEGREYDTLTAWLADRGIANVNSPKQVLDRLHKLGIRAVNASAEALAPYAGQEIVKNIIIASQLASNLNSRLRVFKDYAHNGRLISEWHPFGTASYRMVAKDPNLMAQPLKDRESHNYAPLAELFNTPDTYVLQLDIAQAEVRLAAMVSRCNSMAGLLASGHDAYMEMAKKAYGEANSENRQKAKRATLASIYEEGPNAFSLKHGVPVDEATTILNQFRASFPEIKAMSRQYAAFAGANGYINLYTGRRIYFDKADERLYRAFNQEVQGGLAELMREYMLSLDRAFPGAMIGQIHDSVLLCYKRSDIKRSDIDEIRATTLELLQAALPDKVATLTNPVIPLKLDYEPLVKIYDEEF